MVGGGDCGLGGCFRMRQYLPQGKYVQTLPRCGSLFGPLQLPGFWRFLAGGTGFASGGRRCGFDPGSLFFACHVIFPFSGWNAGAAQCVIFLTSRLQHLKQMLGITT